MINTPIKTAKHPKCRELLDARVKANEGRDTTAPRIGVSKGTLSNWETGHTNPFGMCEAWANAFGYDLVLIKTSENRAQCASWEDHEWGEKHPDEPWAFCKKCGESAR